MKIDSRYKLLKNILLMESQADNEIRADIQQKIANNAWHKHDSRCSVGTQREQ